MAGLVVRGLSLPHFHLSDRGSTVDNRFSWFCILLAQFCLLLVPFTLSAQPYDPAMFQDLRWRSIGPFRGGRTVAISGIPAQPNVFYMAPNDGGVWKTTDAGRTWNPIFDDQPNNAQPTGSIGALAIAPSNPNIIYVGSGEGLRRPDLSVGDGIYKSTDAGQTWQHLGQGDSGQDGSGPVSYTHLHRDQAFAVNCEGAVNVAQAARAAGARLLFLSTDYVFDGTKRSPYEITDARNSTSVYGESKARAEERLQEILPEVCIARTSWLFGHGGKCFPATILKLASTRPEISVVNDQRGSPTFTSCLLYTSPMMAAALLAASRACGDRCEAASANSVCSSRGLRDAMADTATVPQICCSFSSCCCSSVDKFSFKSFAYVGTVSRSSLSVIVRSPLASLINCRPDPELVEGEGPAVRRDSRPAFLSTLSESE